MLLGAGLWFRDEVLLWRMNGSAAIQHSPLRPLGRFPVAMGAGGRIICLGDSNMRGSNGFGGYAEQAAAGLGVRIINRAKGGATAQDGLGLLRDVKGGDLVIVSYGSNDAAPRDWLSTRKAVPAHDYRSALQRIIADAQSAGASVLVLAPLPAGSKAMDRRIGPYRLAAREAAIRQGAAFADPAEVMNTIAVPLRHDALHLRPHAQRSMGLWLRALVGIASDG